MKCGWFQARVASKREDAKGVFVFELLPVDAQHLPSFEAGAHVDLRVGERIGQYSLCNSPKDCGGYVIAIQRRAEGRGASREACDSIEAGSVVALRGPRNHFRITKDTDHALLLAAGIGVTPLLSMAEQLSASDVPFDLHLCSRSEGQTPFVERLRCAPYRDAVQFHFGFSRTHAAAALPTMIGAPASGRHLYICGPGGFIEAAISAARSLGWRDGAVHAERFSAEPAANGEDTHFVVQIRSSGQLIDVPKGATVVQALAGAGIEVLTSCSEGLCGTCATGVLRGRPDHRDQVLTEEERAGNQVFTPCCSRSLTDVLVLDL